MTIGPNKVLMTEADVLAHSYGIGSLEDEETSTLEDEETATTPQVSSEKSEEDDGKAESQPEGV